MKLKYFVLIAAHLVAACGQSALAQQGVTVQLPTFSFFSVATTVVVPDRGGMYMGGVGRASSGSNRFGPSLPGQSAFGFERHATGMHVSAQIHDLRAMDEAIRGKSGPVVAGLGNAQNAKVDPLPSLQEIAQQQRANERSQQAEALEFLKRAKEAQTAGKFSLAKTYLQMGLRRAQGSLREEISAHLANLTPPAAPRLADQR